ncbi:MAG: cysteine desulfurase family protein [Bdellovibrionota bacterium]
MQKMIYLDHNATTPLSQKVIDQIPSILQAWGNPSSIHWSGREPKNLIRNARQVLATALKVSPLEIIFNSGASEGNSAVILGIYEIFKNSKNHFMCSQVEHPSVLKAFQHIEKLGARVDYIPVSRKGELDLNFFKKHISSNTALVSVMMANNETGNIFPIAELVKMTHAVGALFHSDCVQVLGKIPLNLSELNVDYATLSAHKFYSLKGTGALFVRKNSPYQKFIFGGGQERSRRGGTENTLGIASFGVMANLLDQVVFRQKELAQLRDHMEARILLEIDGVSLTGNQSARLPNTSSMVLRDIDGETLLMSLDLKGFAVSTGAACSSGSPEPSPVLLAMGLSRAEAQSSLRISLGWETNLGQIDFFINILKEVVLRLRNISQKTNMKELSLMREQSL